MKSYKDSIKEKKDIEGKKENDPEWVVDIASCVNPGETEENKKELRELFLTYTREGLNPKEAWKKAKGILECFKIKK